MSNEFRKYKDLFDTLDVGIVYQDAKGSILEVNLAAEKILGRSQEEMRSMNSVSGSWKAIQEDGSSFPGKEHPAMVALNTGKRIKNVIMGVFNPQLKEHRWININAVPEFKEGEKKPYRVYTAFSDITENKKAKEKLEKNHQALNEAQRRARLGNWELNLKSNTGFWSNIMAELFYHDLRKGMPSFGEFLQRIHPEDRDNLMKLHRKASNNYGDFETEYRTNPQYGPLRHINAHFIHEPENPTILSGTCLDITQRKETEEQLRLFKHAVDSSTNAVGMSTAEGRHWYQNKAFNDLFGDVGEDPPATLYVNEEIGRKIFNSVMKGKEWIGDVRMYGKNQKILDIYLQAYSLKDKNDNVIGLAGIHTDITERKKIQEKLKLTQFGMDHSQVSVFQVNDDGVIYYANQYSCEALGYTLEELTSKKIWEIDRDLDPERWLSHRKKTKRQRVSKIETKHTRKDGSTFPVEVEIDFIEFEDKMLSFSYARDITERKKWEYELQEQNIEYQSLNEEYIAQNEELVESLERIQKINKELEKAKIIAEESEKKYRTAFYTSPDAININTMDGEYIDVNEGFLNITGYSCDEVIGKTSGELNIWVDLKDREKLFTGLKEEGVVENLVTTFRMKNGEHRSGLMSAAIIKLQGEPHILSITRDITERIKIEEELLEAKEKAEESDRLKTSFLANMSHEIRTPMNGILGFTDLLQEPDINNKLKKKYIELIHESGQRMLDIINDLVDISKIETGQIDLKISGTDLIKIFEELYEFFKPYFEQKGIDLRYRYENKEQLRKINTDATKISQTLTNLLKNAIKYTNDGNVEYGLNIKPVKNSQEKIIEFYVKDTGIGVDPGMRELIFDRFRQGHFSYANGYEGAGLGLSISKAYIEALGGKIWVEPAKTKGSVFYFTIPCIFEEDKTTDDKDIIKMTQMNPLIGLNVLIVEDDEISYMFLKEILTPAGVKIIRAGDGKQAVKLVKESDKIDMILMDIKMPVMGGLEATGQIKKLKPEIPIIMQTAFASSVDEQKSFQAGCDDYISKPIKKDELLNKMSRIAKNTKTNKSA